MQGSHKSGPERMCLCAVCFHMRVGFSVCVCLLQNPQAAC